MRIEINLDEATAQAIEARATAARRSRKNYIENLCKIAATYPIQHEDPPALKKPTMQPVSPKPVKENKKNSPPKTYLEPIPLNESFYPGAIVSPDQYIKKTNPAGYIFTTQDGRSFFVSVPAFYFEGFNYEFTADNGQFEDACLF